jgi:DNA-binding MarR family transcriptional regulator
MSGRKPRPDPLPLELWVGYRFGLLATHIGAMLQPVTQGKHKLSTSSWRVMAVVARYEPCSAAVLSSHSRLDPSKVSRAIEVLVDRKMLRRRKDPEDQRRAVLTLTPLGRRTYEDCATHVRLNEAYYTATLTAAERKAMWSAVDKMEALIAQLALKPAVEE